MTRLIFVLFLNLICLNNISANIQSSKSLQSEKTYIEKEFFREKNITSFEEKYELASNYLKSGELLLSDSIINSVLTSGELNNDSIFYIKFKLLTVEQFKILDEFEAALKELYKLNLFAKRKNNKKLILETYIALAELHRALQNFNIGLTYLEIAEELISQLKEEELTEQLIRVFNRRAAILLEKNINLDSVETLSLKAIQLSKSIKNLDLEAVSSNEVGYLYYNLGNYELAENYLKNAIDNWERLGFHLFKANAKVNLARVYLKTNKLEKGINLLLNSLLNVGSDWDWTLVDHYQLLSELYRKNNELEKALEMSKLGNSFKIKLFKKGYNKKLDLFTSRLELQQKQQEIELQKEQIISAELQSELKNNQNKGLFWLILFLFLLLVSVSILFLVIRSQKKNLAQHQKEILKANSQLTRSVTQKEILLNEVNHRVKNNLSVLSGMLYLQESSSKNQAIKNALQSSQNRISAMAMVHESMIQNNDFKRIDFNSYLQELGSHLIDIYSSIELNLSMNINCELLNPPLSIAIPLGMIIHELLTNSIKYAIPENNKLEVNISYSNNCITYQDNGSNFETVLFKESKGLGNKIITIFSTQIHATLQCEEVNNGFFLQINLTDKTWKTPI